MTYPAPLKLPASIENLLNCFRQQRAEDKVVVMQLQDEIDRLKAREISIKAESLAEAYESLFKDLSSPVSQLLLQLHVSDNQEHSLSASDVLAHVKNLVAALERHGLTVMGQPEDIQPFDPNQHQSIVESFQPAKGEPVRICFPGISYRDALLRKAAVASAEEK